MCPANNELIHLELHSWNVLYGSFRFLQPPSNTCSLFQLFIDRMDAYSGAETTPKDESKIHQHIRHPHDALT